MPPFDNPILEMERPTYKDVSIAIRRYAERKVGVRLFPHFLPGRGELGEELVCQEIRIGHPEPTNCWVFNSGLHGVEGAAGSAAIYDFMGWSEHFVRKLNEPTEVRLIESVNPYGFSVYCRYNQEGVDLNRNFRKYPTNGGAHEAYRKLNAAINPSSLDLCSELYSLAELELSSLFRGKTRLMQAIAMGQDLYPKGVQYGGKEPAPENRMIRSIIRSLPPTIKRLVWIDCHSGLGAPRKVQLMCEYPDGSPEHLRMERWFGTLLMPPKEVEAMTTNPGNLGAIDQAIREEMREINPGAQVTTTCMEIGTYGTMKSVWAVRARNWARHFGKSNEACVDRLKKKMIQIFYPPERPWREALREAAKQIMSRSFLAFLEPTH